MPADLDLLRRYEPVLRFTRGEMFFPVDVTRYVERAALVRGHGRTAEVVVDHGQLDLTGLTEHARRAGPAAALSLRFVDRPMDRRELRAWSRGAERPAFTRISVTAAVGLLARVAAAIIRLSLLLRGRVPGGYAARASERLGGPAQERPCTYYGRVTTDAGYLVLQYWFLYPMNDWRSSFGGVNDHEADWEQITLFLAEAGPGQRPKPAWVAFSSHDETGADLRRRWDDPDLTRVGDHPVVFVGAGSHSGAYLPGEYLVTVAPNLPAWLTRARRQVLRILPWADPDSEVVGIPYVDYRRGDGVAVGPGQDREWQAWLVDDTTPWLRDFTGLWGLDTSDPLGGERAPAGPRYERDGSVRTSWAQPVAWAALDGEPPTEGDSQALWAGRPSRLHAQRTELDQQLDAARTALREQVVADRVAGLPERSPSPRRRQLAAAVAALRRAQTLLDAAADATGPTTGRAAVPLPGVHEHLRARAVPLGAESMRWTRLLGLWSAVSAALLFAALGLLLLSGRNDLLPPTVGLLVVMLLVEALLRRRLARLLLRVGLTALVLVGGWLLLQVVAENLRVASGVLLLLAAGYILLSTVADAIGARGGSRGAGADGG